MIKLVRIRMGPLLLGDLAPREYRFLTDREANRLRDLVEDRVARAERPELDASGKPARWMPPTEPAPPRPPKPERSGRGPKVSTFRTRAAISTVSGQCEAFTLRSRSGAAAHESGRQYRRPAHGRVFSAPNGGTPQGPARSRRGRRIRWALRRTSDRARANAAAHVNQGQDFNGPRSEGKTSKGRSWRDGAPLWPWPESQPNRRGSPSASRQDRGDCAKSRPSTRRRA